MFRFSPVLLFMQSAVMMRNALLLALGLASFGLAAPLESRQAEDIVLEAEDGELSGTEVLTDLAGFSGQLMFLLESPANDR